MPVLRKIVVRVFGVFSVLSSRLGGCYLCEVAPPGGMGMGVPRPYTNACMAVMATHWL